MKHQDHHYIPQFYLGSWSDSSGKVMRYYRPHSGLVASPITPRGTGFEVNLYALKDVSEADRQRFESDFMTRHVDTPASIALDIMAQDNSVDRLTAMQKYDWAKFLFSLEHRTPERKKRLDVSAEDVLTKELEAAQTEYEGLKADDDPPTSVEAAQKYLGPAVTNIGLKTLADAICNPRNIAMYVQMHWRIVAFQQDITPLLTCDRPLYRSSGCGDPKCVVVIPLSPYHAFVASNFQIGKIEHRRFARSINDVLVSQSFKHVYGVRSADKQEHEKLKRFIDKRLAPSPA